MHHQQSVCQEKDFVELGVYAFVCGEDASTDSIST